MKDEDIQRLVDAFSNKEEPLLAPGKTLNILVMGVVGAVGALIWNSVAPTANFSELQNQTTEIRTAVLEMKTAMSNLTVKLDKSQEQASEQQSRIASLETVVKNNREDIDQLDSRVGELERRR